MGYAQGGGAVTTADIPVKATGAEVSTGSNDTKFATPKALLDSDYVQQAALDLKANLISPSFTTPALGTPSAGTLTNCTTATAAAGDNDTSLASTAFVQGLGQGILRYTALLTFANDADPTVVATLENSFGGTIVWARSSEGVYTATLAGAFPAAKCVFFITNSLTTDNISSGTVLLLYRTNDNVASLDSYNSSGVPADITSGVNGNASVMILRYP